MVRYLLFFLTISYNTTHIHVDVKPQTVLYEKNISFETRLGRELSDIFFHTELFEAYIVLNTLSLN